MQALRQSSPKFSTLCSFSCRNCVKCEKFAIFVAGHVHVGIMRTELLIDSPLVHCNHCNSASVQVSPCFCSNVRIRILWSDWADLIHSLHGSTSPFLEALQQSQSGIVQKCTVSSDFRGHKKQEKYFFVCDAISLFCFYFFHETSKVLKTKSPCSSSPQVHAVHLNINFSIDASKRCAHRSVTAMLRSMLSWKQTASFTENVKVPHGRSAPASTRAGDVCNQWEVYTCCLCEFQLT